MLTTRQQFGFTLIELMTVLAVVVILAALAVPQFDYTMQRRRVVGAADQFYADLQYARSEAIKQNKTVTVNVKTGAGAQWCYGLDDDLSTACDCQTGPANCTIGTVQKTTSNWDNTAFRDITLSASANTLTINPRRGTVTPAATFTLTPASIDAKTVQISVMGRVTVN